METIALSWTRYIELIDKLNQKILEAHKADAFNMIIGIGRGGLIPAVCISHFLDVPLATVVAKVYKGTTAQPEEFTLSHLASLEKLEHSKVLVVDDIVDSAITMTKVIEYLHHDQNIKLLKTAVVIKKIPNTFAPDYFAAETNIEKWLKFPYEKCLGGPFAYL